VPGSATHRHNLAALGEEKIAIAVVRHLYCCPTIVATQIVDAEEQYK
jgi:hypothetical protein